MDAIESLLSQMLQPLADAAEKQPKRGAPPASNTQLEEFLAAMEAIEKSEILPGPEGAAGSSSQRDAGQRPDQEPTSRKD